MSSLVPVFVESQDLSAVYRWLADRRAGDSAEPASESAGSASTEPLAPSGMAGAADPRFTDPAFVRAHLGPRSDTVRGAARYLAERPGEWATSESIADALGLEYGWNSLAGAFGAAANYFSNREIGMPWHWTYETPDRHVRLMMDAETAEVILQAL